MLAGSGQGDGRAFFAQHVQRFVGVDQITLNKFDRPEIAIRGADSLTDVLAIDESLVATLGAERFNLLLRESREANDWMLKGLVEMVRELSDRVFEVSALGVQNRVHAEVLRLAREAGIRDNRAVIDPAPTHPDIASRISTYREQVTRELSAMVKQGLLERAEHALVVPDVMVVPVVLARSRRRVLSYSQVPLRATSPVCRGSSWWWLWRL